MPRTTHGLSYSKVYMAYHNMLRRCYDEDHAFFEHYGGRGITVCGRWRNSFENFYSDMGEPPTPKHSLDRKEGDGNYSPKNCRWATQEEQNNNRRGTVNLTHNGITASIAVWCRKLGVSRGCLCYRLRAGWTVPRALTQERRLPLACR